MAANLPFVLGDHFSEFVEEQMATGRYDSASDVVRAGLRLLEDQETRLSALRAALIDGENSGATAPFDLESFVERKRKGQVTAP